MADGEVVLGDGELRALLVLENLGEQAGERVAGRRVAEGEVLERRDVVRARQELARARLTVAAGAPDLLRVRLEALREVEVVDVADVGLVDAHPEGDRGDDDVPVGARPPVLHGHAVLGAHAGVVGTGGEPGGGEQRGNAKRRALQRHVDDRRAGRALAQPGDQQLIALGGGDRRGQQGQVGPVEARDDRVRLVDAEAVADVGGDGRRGGRGQGEHPLGPELACARCELQVVGSEVVAPLGDAVRLVHGEQRDLRPHELSEEPLVVEPLRGDVEQLQAARAKPLGDVAKLVRAEARVEPSGVDALADEEVDLILHQRDQRRDDDRDAVEQERRELIAEALAGARREDRERGAARQQRLDDLLLAGAERGEAEPGAEDVERALSGVLGWHGGPD